MRCEWRGCVNIRVGIEEPLTATNHPSTYPHTRDDSREYSENLINDRPLLISLTRGCSTRSASGTEIIDYGLFNLNRESWINADWCFGSYPAVIRLEFE